MNTSGLPFVGPLTFWVSLMRPDLAALVARADRELLGDVGMRSNDVVDDLLVLGVGVEVLEARRLAGGRHRLNGEQQQADQAQGQRKREHVGGSTARHCRDVARLHRGPE